MCVTQLKSGYSTIVAVKGRAHTSPSYPRDALLHGGTGRNRRTTFARGSLTSVEPQSATPRETASVRFESSWMCVTYSRQRLHLG